MAHYGLPETHNIYTNQGDGCLFVCLWLMTGQTEGQIHRVFWGLRGLQDGECLRQGFTGAAGKQSEPK